MVHKTTLPPGIKTQIIHDGEMWMWEATRKMFHITTPITSGRADTKRAAILRMNKHIRQCVYQGDENGSVDLGADNVVGRTD